MNKIAIVGHKNPDTDSIVSAIAAQEYFTNVLKREAMAFRAGELNNETKFILEHFTAQVPEMIGELGQDGVVALVDHNEISQIADGIGFEKVEYVFDHHKLLISTEKPIFCRCEPLGSTSSLLAKLFEESDMKPSESVTKLLLAGILSDTLNLASPTTTQEDRLLVERLNDIANIEIGTFCEEMFKAKSSLEGIGAAEIISLDYKVFEMGNKKIGIGTWETTDPQTVNEKNAEIKQQLILKKEENGLSMIFFMVVDIIKQNCFLYVISRDEKDVAMQVFGGEESEDIIKLVGVVSRKKQIVPPLTEYLSK
jgi:manganese-dependent inorganic pyrophosphatase